MKRKNILRLWVILFGLCMMPRVAAQEGTWSGKLNLGSNSLQLVFHFQNDSCTLDSPNQGVKGIAVKRNPVPLPTLSLSIPTVGAEFKGVWMGEQIIGTFVQMGQEFPLTLKPGAALHKRPQTPKDTSAYRCEEVSFANGKAMLKGTLTLPADCNSGTPVLLMVTGSGLQNRDEEIFEHKPFAVLADAFARHGIATLRYDDRGFGQSTGDVVNATIDDFKSDAQAGIELLRKRFRKVGVLGHSEGGTIGLMLAAEKQVDFVVSLAGMVISGKETLLIQNRNLLKQMGYTEAVVDEYLHALEQVFDAVIEGMKPQVENNVVLPNELNVNLQQVALALRTSYLSHFLKLDVSTIVSSIQCPVLALNGTKDTQVDCQANLEPLKKELRSAGSEVVPCDGLNHLFQPCNTGSVDEYVDIEQTFAVDVIDRMIHWIQQLP